MIKLVVSDIDGTLLPDGGHDMNPELYEVILKLRKAGMQFAAASGRQWASIEQVFDPIKEKIFYLSDNGAYVGCCGRRLIVNPIDRHLVVDMIQDIRSAGLIAMYSGPDMVYLDDPDEDFYDWLVNGYKFRVQRVEDVLKVDDPCIKISAYKKFGIEPATTAIREKYNDKMKITISGDMSMTFGDQLNDIEMLKQAYYSFAVANARPEVKEAARFETDSNVQDGVLKILKFLV